MYTHVTIIPNLYTSVNMDLREYLFRHNVTTTDFAKKLGVTRVYVHKWMDGSRVPSKDTLNRISELTKGVITTLEQLIDARKLTV